MLYWVAQQILWEVTAGNGAAWDVGIWTATVLDLVLWIGLAYVVGATFLRTVIRR